MIQHDKDVGKLLDLLDTLKIADNTIVIYTTDNGPNAVLPGPTPQPRHSATRRIPTGKAHSVFPPWRAGPVTSSRSTWAPPKCSPVRTGSRRCSRRQAIPDIKERLLKGASIGSKTFKVHLDGYNQLPYLTGRQPHSARHEFFYFDDDGDLVGCASTRVDAPQDAWKFDLVRTTRSGRFSRLGRTR